MVGAWGSREAIFLRTVAVVSVAFSRGSPSAYGGSAKWCLELHVEAVLLRTVVVVSGASREVVRW